MCKVDLSTVCTQGPGTCSRPVSEVGGLGSSSGRKEVTFKLRSQRLVGERLAGETGEWRVVPTGGENAHSPHMTRSGKGGVEESHGR